MQISFIICPRQTKVNDCTNVHHAVVKNGVFINYNIFLYEVSKTFSVIFNEQICLYSANEQ